MRTKWLALAVWGVISLSVALFAQPVQASVNSFYFSGFEADYYLSKDAEGRSALKVVEKLTAEFPDFDQNKGIERAIPLSYDRHPVSLQFQSLKRNGNPEPIYEQRTENGNRVIATGTEEYIRGTQVFEFIYTMRDVTKDSGTYQELFWDTNGTEWYQSFEKVVARVHLDSSITSTFTGETVCFEGESGSKATCPVKVEGSTVSFTSTGMFVAGENLTLGLKFKPNTFAARPFSIFDYIGYIPGILGLLVVGFAMYVRHKFNRDHPGRGTIVPEYLPPKDLSVLLAAQLYKAKLGIPAQIIDLAVRHKLRIIESEEKGFFGNTIKKYTVEIISTTGLLEDEKAFIQTLTGNLAPGTRYTLDPADTSRGLVMQTLIKSYEKLAESGGFRRENNAGQMAGLAVVGVGVSAIVLGFLLIIFNQETGFTISFIGLGVGFASVFVSSALLHNTHPLSQQGREVYDYLKGLEMYIKLAEADRLKILQSPQGAEKTPVNTSDNAQIVKLYERVLPYAVLFGQEKEWAKQLSIRYEELGKQPDWYHGASSFNAASFASSLGSFSTATNSYSPSSSSSSGGFSGGGSSGGGGGGGGGGGR